MFELVLAGFNLTDYCNEINNRGANTEGPSLALYITGGLLCSDK